jgi:hypothetical protein
MIIEVVIVAIEVVRFLNRFIAQIFGFLALHHRCFFMLPSQQSVGFSKLYKRIKELPKFGVKENVLLDYYHYQ